MKRLDVRKWAVHRSDASWLLLVFVLLALLALVVVPLLGNRHVEGLEAQLRDVAEPARGILTEVQLALATGGAAARDLVDTGDSTFLRRYEAAVTQERAAYQRLEPLIEKLGPHAVVQYDELRRLERRWDAHLTDLVRGSRTTQDAAERSKQLDLYEETLISAAQLDHTITAMAGDIRMQVTAAERRVLTLTSGLVVLAAAAALVVAHLGRRLRRYAQLSETRRAALEEVLQSKARLMGGITHDLKNPLNVIDGHAQLLSQGIRGELTPAQHDSVSRIRRAVDTLLELIQTLLEMSRAEAGHLKIEQAAVDARALVQDVVEQQRAVAELSGLVLKFESDGSSPTVISDAARISQILANLVGNAVKYTGQQKHGEVNVHLSSRLSGPTAGKWLAIDVIDTGPGIPADFHARIFQEFARANTTTEGAGLGLAISRQLARLLGGDITFESKVGEGSTFTFWLPCS